MAASNYSGTKAERDDYERVLGIERKHIALEPEGEREEIRQIFAAKGFAGDDLERIVAVITSDRDAVDQNHGGRGVRSCPDDPVRRRSAALSTFAAFIACGLVPLVTYLSLGRPARLPRRDRRDILRRRRHQEPVVADVVVALRGRYFSSSASGAAAMAFAVGFGIRTLINLPAV